MLPDSTQIRNNSNLTKFADTGLDELIKQMENEGANKMRLVAKIAGGAQTFACRGRASLCEWVNVTLKL